MGWHASNFRAGTRPDVVVDFYATMGDWDVLVSEEPHVTGADWWEPWPEDAVATNLDWMQTVTDGSGLPLLLWQMPIGFEGRLLDPSLSPRGVERFAEAGVVGVLFEHIAHRGETDPDAIRADGDSGAVPPADAVTDGTAAGLREQMIAYARDPMRFPAGSVCAVDGSGPGDAPVEGTGGSPQSEPGPPGGAPPLADEPTPAPANEPNPRPADDDGSCACSVPGFERSNRVTWVLLSCLLFVVGLRREGCSRYPNERTSTRAWHRSASTYIPRAPRRPDPARR
jgi:hypothetical protein